MRVLVVSACSKAKRRDPGLLPARVRYTGRAHERVRTAIDQWRARSPQLEVEWCIVSAGLGLVEEEEPIEWYDATFNGLSLIDTRAASERLNLRADLTSRLRAVDAACLVLPRSYIAAVDAPFAVPTRQWYFTASDVRPSDRAHAWFVRAGGKEARHLGVSPREVGAAVFACWITQYSGELGAGSPGLGQAG